MYLSSGWVKERGLNTQEGYGRRARLALNSAGERGHDDRACLGLEERIDDSGLFASDVVVKPVPRFRIDGFANAGDDTEGAEVCILDVFLSETTEETNSSGCGVEVGEFVLVDSLPVARRRGVDRR